MIITADQTSSKYVPVERLTLTEKNVKGIPISGCADKRSITATFAEGLDGSFLPFQLIYKGKTTQSLPKIDFPDGFSLSVNEKHFSNTQESIKFLKEIVIPFVDKKRSELKNPSQAALLIWDVFRGQKTTPVLDILKENNIITEYVPNNMTNYYQPLDCTTNKCAKDFLKAKFSTWFSKQVQKHLDKGIALEDIDVRFQLTTMKPLHATWLIDLYNELTSPRAKDVIIAGWKKSGTWDALKLGSRGLPSIDPFKEIEPMDSDYIVQIEIDPVAKDNEHDFNTEKEICDTDTTHSEWEEADDRSTSGIFDE